MAVLHSSNCRRMDLGKVCSPNSFPVSEPVWSARWKAMGLVMEIVIIRVRPELGAIVPTM